MRLLNGHRNRLAHVGAIHPAQGFGGALDLLGEFIKEMLANQRGHVGPLHLRPVRKPNRLIHLRDRGAGKAGCRP